MDRWDERATEGLGEAQLLVYRSNLLGSDRRITNFGGGNTSAKIEERDPLTGESHVVLWVKGSGGDLGSASLEGFASLYLDKLRALKSRYRGLEHEDEMPGQFPHCTFNLNQRASSIDTPLHAFIPHRHIDHMHADALIAIAAARNGEQLMARIFGGELGVDPLAASRVRPRTEGWRCHQRQPQPARADSRWARRDHLGPDRSRVL